MSVKKSVLLIISLAILGLVMFAFLQVTRHPKIRRIRAVFKDKAKVVYDNLLNSVTASRKPPITTIELEESLKGNLSVPFASFNQDDWKWFWHLLYERFAEDVDEWPRRMKQLTRQEIQNILVDYYEKPFGSFSQRQWDIFWRDVLKGRVF